MLSFRSSAVVALAVASASAIQLSQSCSQTLFGLLLDSEASACFNAPGLINDFINITDTKNDPIGAATSYINGLCSNGYCSDSTLETVLRNVTSGCADDLASVGANIDLTPNTLSNIEAGYKAVREVLCLKDTSSGDLCVIDSVKQAGQILGQPASAEAIFAALFGDKSALDTLLDDAKAGCTPCAKAAYTIAESDFPSVIDQGKDAVQSVCGADFVDGQFPSNIQRTAANGTVSEIRAKQANGASTAFGFAGIQVASVGAAVALGMLFA